jgi:signal peptidase II
MKSTRHVKIILILLIIIGNIGCDQISKKIIRENIIPNQTVHLLSSQLTVTNVENSGAFLSLGDSLHGTIKNILLTLFPFTAIILGLIYVITKRNLSTPMLAGFCFIIGGGIGNLFDRMVYGSVTDFLHIDFGIFHTGIFNMADLSIMIGIFIIFLQSFSRNVSTS